MEAEIAQQNKIQSSIRQEAHSLKRSANELKDKIANLSIALRELQAEERNLSKEVVDSPNRIRSELAKAGAEAAQRLHHKQRMLEQARRRRELHLRRRRRGRLRF